MLTGYSGWRATSGCGSVIVLLANPEGCNTFLLSASEGALASHFCVCCEPCALSPLVIRGTVRLPLCIAVIVVSTQRKRVYYTGVQQLERAVEVTRHAADSSNIVVDSLINEHWRSGHF